MGKPKPIPPPYPKGPFTPQSYVGGYGGTTFMECRWGNEKSGLIVSGMDVWYDDSGINGLRLRYGNDEISKVWGTQNSSQKTLLMKAGERITNMTMWDNGKGSQVGRISITTTIADNTLDVGKNTKGQTAFSQPIGSGILVGVDGYSSKNLNMLGFIFLNSPIQSITVKDVEYNPPLAGSQQGITSVSLKEATYTNPGTTDKSFKFDGTTERTNSTTFTQTSATMYGMNLSVTVTAEVFGIGGSVDTGFQWQNTDTQENQVTTSSTEGLGWGISGPLAPGYGVNCQAICMNGTGSTNYTSNVTLTLKSGYSITYPEVGTIQCVEFTKAFATATDFKLDDEDVTVNGNDSD